MNNNVSGLEPGGDAAPHGSHEPDQQEHEGEDAHPDHSKREGVHWLAPIQDLVDVGVPLGVGAPTVVVGHREHGVNRAEAQGIRYVQEVDGVRHQQQVQQHHHRVDSVGGDFGKGQLIGPALVYEDPIHEGYSKGESDGSGVVRAVHGHQLRGNGPKRLGGAVAHSNDCGSDGGLVEVEALGPSGHVDVALEGVIGGAGGEGEDEADEEHRQVGPPVGQVAQTGLLRAVLPLALEVLRQLTPPVPSRPRSRVVRFFFDAEVGEAVLLQDLDR